MAYDYKENVIADVMEYIRENYDTMEEVKRDEERGELYDSLFIADSVTGNGSGSYYCNTWEAEESLCHNMELLGEALEEFGCDGSYIMEHGAEACDVTIRCYLLGEAIGEAIEELEAEGWGAEEDDEEGGEL